MTEIDNTSSHLTTIRDYIRWGASQFNQAKLFFGHGTANAMDEAAALVLHAVHQSHDLPVVYFGSVLMPEERLAVIELIQRRIKLRIPAAYLIREAWFCHLPFYVDERVLVPRSPVAELIENRFAPWLSQDMTLDSVLDLCTGSGCIAIAVAYAFPEARVDAVDISSAALEVAQRNIEQHDMDDTVTAIRSDLFDGLQGKRYDLIISNPPYVSRQEWEALPPEYHAEPKLGLESGESGLDCVRRILCESADHLNPGGFLIVEVGSSASALEAAYPDVPFYWLDFERGGDGVFLLTVEQLSEHRHCFG